MQKREKHGYLQVRFEGERYWQFVIYGFGDNDCTVIKADGEKERVPIDDKNRITINGRKYGRSFWYH